MPACGSEVLAGGAPPLRDGGMANYIVGSMQEGLDKNFSPLDFSPFGTIKHRIKADPYAKRGN